MIGKEILNYRIVAPIGKGGMGSVWLAEHKFIANQKVAIKVIHADMVNDWTRSRLKEEAEHLAGLRHGNIVAFHDYHIDEEGNIYLIMEYAEGKNLEDYIRTQSGLIVQERVCPLFEPILDAVGYAHKHNILHRDIKPSNVVITTEGIPKILDFGIATVIKRDSTAASDKFIVGTPSYMSPEQVRGEQLDERSDIYSLGVMLHVMLTGNPPYDTTTLTETEIHQKIVEEPLPRLRSFYKYVSEPVQKVVDKATAKNPADRYRSCAEFKQALHNAVYPPKRGRGAIVGLIVLLLVAAGAGAWLWDYNRLKVEYFKDYVEQWGVPQGIGKVSADQQKQRILTYRFESQKGKLRKVKIVNSKGHLRTEIDSEFSDRPSEQQLFYTDDGHIDYVKILDQHGKVLYRKDYNDNLTVAIFQYDDQYNTELTLGSNDITYGTDVAVNTEEKSRISRHLLTYDERGFVVKREYAGPYNKKVGDKSGVYGQAYLLDDKGRVIESQYLGFDGQPRALKNGLSIRTYHYNDLDELDETHYLTMSREASNNGQEPTVIKIEHDEFGNRKAERYYDLEGNMTYRTDWYVAGVILEISNGEEILHSYVDVENNLSHHKDGYYYTNYEYDDNGYVSKFCYLDENKQPIATTAGTAWVTMLNDEAGNWLEVWNYGVDGDLAANESGIAGFKLEYDSIGNNTKLMPFNTQGMHHQDDLGVYGQQYEYNDKSQLVRIIYIDSLCQPMCIKTGQAIINYEYDAKGNRIKETNLATDGLKLVNNNETGVAVVNRTFDENGNQIKIEYFDAENNLVNHNGLYSTIKLVYDENNNQTAYYCYDNKGKFALSENGFAGKEYKVDRRGNIIESVPLGTDGKLKKTYLITRYKYDEQDNRIEEAYFDAKQKPAIGSERCHKVQYSYDERGNVISQSYFDTKGKPTLTKDNYAKVEGTYDQRGKVVEQRYFDVKGNLCKNKEGFAIKKIENDVFGRRVKEEYFDVNGKPTDPKVMVPVALCGYDERGNLNYVAAQDGKGNFIIHPSEGFAIGRFKFDNKGNQIELAYFNQKDEPMVVKGSAHIIRKKYDAMGNTTEEAYFNTKDQPMLVNGAHIVKYSYSNSGNLTIQRYLGTKQQPVNNSYGNHKLVFSYDSSDNLKACKIYDAKGKLLRKLNWTSSGWKLDESGSNTQSKVAQKKQTDASMSWQEKVMAIDGQLPMDLGEKEGHMSIESFRVTSNNACLLKFVFPMDYGDMSVELKDAIKSEVNALTKYFCEQLDTPGLSVDSNTFSADGKLIHATSYKM